MHGHFRHTLAVTSQLLAVSHLTDDDWSLPSAHFVDRRCPFRCSFGAFFYWTRCFENNVPFDNTTLIYLINLLWKLRLGFGSDS